MEQIRFDNQSAIVTGAGSGLGRIYALELARRGAKVVVNDLGGRRDGSGAGSVASADTVVNEIKAQGGTAVADYNSVATPEGGEAVVETAKSAFGRVDILINNAGIIRDRTLIKMESEDWRQVVAVHLDGAYYVTRPAFMLMKDNRFGRIIFTTSAAGLYGNFGQCNYSAAKLGLVGFMNTLKMEGEKYNIKTNAVAPVAATRLTDDILPDDLKRQLQPEHIAPLVLYLCSSACPVSGALYNAAPGYYSRAAVLTGPGKRYDLNDGPPSPENIAADFTEISKIDQPVEWNSATQALGEMLKADLK